MTTLLLDCLVTLAAGIAVGWFLVFIQIRDQLKRIGWHKHYALLPTKFQSGRWVWLQWIERRWNPETNLRFIHQDDRGEYHGDWEYRLP
jgi:hypothetical protein